MPVQPGAGIANGRQRVAAIPGWAAAGWKGRAAPRTSIPDYPVEVEPLVGGE